MKITVDDNQFRMTRRLGVAWRLFSFIASACMGLLLVSLTATFAADPMGFLDREREGAASIAMGILMAILLFGVIIIGLLFLLYSAFRPNDVIVADRDARTIRRSPQSVFRHDAVQYGFSEIRGLTSRHVRVRSSGYEIVQLVTTNGVKVDLTPLGLSAAERDDLIAKLEEFIKCKKDSTN